MTMPRFPAGWLAALPWMAAAAMLSAAAVAADVEKWIDADGRVHYGDQPPANADSRPLAVRPNVIETGGPVQPAVAVPPPAQSAMPVEAAAAPQRRSDIQTYIDHCLDNRGIDCETEARQMIDGPAPLLFPGDPAVFPRPDLKPPPPGLRLKYGITP
jgi:hypothetical protein